MYVCMYMYIEAKGYVTNIDGEAVRPIRHLLLKCQKSGFTSS